MTTIADTTRGQIGLNTLMRIGARNLHTTTGNDLRFLFTYTTPGGARRVMLAQVDLTPADTYTVTVTKTKNVNLLGRVPTEEIARTENLYAETLSRHLQRQAGEADSLNLRPTWEA